jgi:hypothetical protein
VAGDPKKLVQPLLDAPVFGITLVGCQAVAAVACRNFKSSGDIGDEAYQTDCRFKGFIFKRI